MVDFDCTMTLFSHRPIQKINFCISAQIWWLRCLTNKIILSKFTDGEKINSPVFSCALIILHDRIVYLRIGAFKCERTLPAAENTARCGHPKKTGARNRPHPTKFGGMSVIYQNFKSKNIKGKRMVCRTSSYLSSKLLEYKCICN